MLYNKLTIVFHNMDTLTFNCMLHHFLPAYSVMHHYLMCIVGHMFGGCIACIVVGNLVSVFLLCTNDYRIGCSACQSAGIGSAITWLRWLCIHDLLVWNRKGRQL
jgi:hypothetical protein